MQITNATPGSMPSNILDLPLQVKARAESDAVRNHIDTITAPRQRRARRLNRWKNLRKFLNRPRNTLRVATCALVIGAASTWIGVQIQARSIRTHVTPSVLVLSGEGLSLKLSTQLGALPPQTKP